jgi:hypothetical protein
MWKNFITRKVAADLGFMDVTGYRDDRSSWTSADFAPSQAQ